MKIEVGGDEGSDYPCFIKLDKVKNFSRFEDLFQT